MHRALSVFAFYLLLGHQLVSPRGGGGWWGRVQAEVSIIKRCCHHHCHDSLYQSSRGFSSVRQNGWIPSSYYLHAWFTWQVAKLTRFLVDKIAGIWLMAWIFDHPPNDSQAHLKNIQEDGTRTVPPEPPGFKKCVEKAKTDIKELVK